MPATVVKMTQLSMTMLEGVIAKWFKQEGDTISVGEPLLEVESDKVTVEITAPVTGVVRKILAGETEAVPVGGNICIIADVDDDISEYLNVSESNNNETLNKAGRTETQSIAETHSMAEQVERRPKISPLAKKIALASKIDFKALVGSGPGGLIIKSDVEKAQARALKQAAAISEKANDLEFDVLPLSGVRKRIAEHMTISKQNAASVTTVTEVDMSNIVSCRKVIPVSYTTYVVKAVAEALKEFSILNSSLVGEEIHIKKQININVAVAAANSLVTPVVRNAGEKNILTIGGEMDDLALKGREGELTPADFTGGTFTVTNSGVFGSLFFTPIINYPQCAILGMGKVLKMPIVRGDEIVIGHMMYLCLTYDHRIVDGAPAVQFLQRVKRYLENPDEMIKKKA